MEFFIITLALFGGFFKGALNKVSGLDLNYSSNNLEASLLSRTKKLKEIEEIEIQDAASYRLQVTNNFKVSPIKISEVPEPEVNAKSAILLDMETDKIMFAKNSNEKLPIASISKIFTALAVADKLSPDEIVGISQKAVDTESLAGDLKAGEEFRARDLIDLMLISSSNDAAAQLSMKVLESEKDFALLMDNKAKELGLKNTSFSEPTGLSDQNISTAFEIAQVADATFGKSSIWNILGQKEADIYSLDGNKHHLKNTNEIISDDYIIAGKTGYTNKAKGTLVVIANSGQNDRKIVSVVLGSEDRFGDTRVLLEWSRENFKW